MKTWFSRCGISVPPSGTAVMSSGDWLMVMGSPRVSRVGGGVLHGCLDERAGRALAQRSSGEVAGQLEIEVISPVAVGLALGGGRFEDRDIHAGGLDRDLGVVDRLAEEVVGADGPGDVVARAGNRVWACHPSR